MYFANRGSAYKQNGDIKRAIEDLERSVQIDPNYEKGQLRLAQFYEDA